MRPTIKHIKDVTPATIAEILSQAPGALVVATSLYRDARRKYNARLADLGIQAMSEPLFRKNPDDPLKPAGNAEERSAALKKLVAHDPELADLELALDQAHQVMKFWDDIQENFRIIARLEMKKMLDPIPA